MASASHSPSKSSSTLFQQSILRSQDLIIPVLEALFRKADHYTVHPQNTRLQNKVVAMLFFEPSTRTRFSFETAVYQLGGKCISTENAGTFSSVAKGETLTDMIRVVSSYADAIVLRHTQDNAAQEAHDRLCKESIHTPIINAGCGGFAGEHPTQSLTDVYTIRKELGRLNNLNIVMLGDHANSRVVRSLACLLSRYENNVIHFVAPPELSIGKDILMFLDKNDTPYTLHTTPDQVLSDADVVYVTRLQRERLARPDLYEKLKDSYRLTTDMVRRMKSSARIMHPLPRVTEIETTIDVLPQAAYFRQSDNGVPVRKALLDMVLTDS